MYTVGQTAYTDSVPLYIAPDLEGPIAFLVSCEAMIVKSGDPVTITLFFYDDLSGVDPTAEPTVTLTSPDEANTVQVTGAFDLESADGTWVGKAKVKR